MRFIARWPLYLVASGTVVHAGFDPRGGPLTGKRPRIW